MAELSLVYIPDERLKQVAQEVATVDDEIRQNLDDMMDTMYKYHGIGLAGNQVGILKRIIVVDCPINEDDEESESAVYKMVNPKITWKSDEKSVREEGCLSIPTGKGDVERPSEITVKYLDENGKPQELTTGGLLATCIQHEVDHIDGILYTDYLSKLKRDMIAKKVQKYLKGL
ncbi:MAG: peptide deformylase [Alphaproteobacteria bacterium]